MLHTYAAESVSQSVEDLRAGSGGGGDVGRGGGTSRDVGEDLGCRCSGINDGGGILLGGGWRGGGGRTIIGGRVLSTTFDGVRERAIASSRANESVDSIDCRRSERAVRGRGMNEEVESRKAAMEGLGVAGRAVVVGPADGGGEMN